MKAVIPPKGHGTVLMSRRFIHEAEGAVHAKGLKNLLPENSFPLLPCHCLHNAPHRCIHDIAVLGQGAEWRIGFQIFQPLQKLHPGNGIIRPGAVMAAYAGAVAEHIPNGHHSRRLPVPEGKAGNVGSNRCVHIKEPFLRKLHHRQGGHGLAAGADAADGVRKERMAFGVPDAKAFQMHLSPVNDADGHAGNSVIIHHLPDETG